MNAEEKYYCKSDLTTYRGWTQSMIKKLLGKPDAEKTNPKYRCAAPMQLYKASRVEKIEKSDEFKSLQEKAKKRRETSRRTVKVKYDETINHVRNIKIIIPEYSERELLNRACNHYNAYHETQFMMRLDCDYEYQKATLDSNKTFLYRIATNYLRHQCTKYEDELDRLFDKIGKENAYHILKQRINDAIYKKYPYLKVTEQ